MVWLWIGCAIFAAVCALSLLLAREAERNAMLSLHQPLRQHTAYVRYMRDKHDLNGFGFAQQLTRHMGGLSTFGLSFSSLPLIGGAIFLLGPAVAAGGPAVIGIGWPILGLFGLLTACSVAAFASAIPTAGGCYHWSLATGGRRSGLWSGWLHAAGSVLLLATTNIWLADWFCRTLQRLWGYTGSSGFFYLVLVTLFITQAAANARTGRVLGRLMSWSAGFQVALLAAILVILVTIAWPGLYPFQILGYTADFWNSVNGAGGGETSAVLGLLLLQRLFLGIGDAAQAGEETRDPRIALPWSIYLSTAGLSILGFVLFAFILLHARVGSEGLRALPALGDWLVDVWGRWGDASTLCFFLLAIVPVWMNGSSTMAAGSRTLFAMARDESIPFAGKLSVVSVDYRVPIRAVLALAAAAGVIATFFVMTVPASSLLTMVMQLVLLSVIAMHAALAIPIAGRLRETLQESDARKASSGIRKRSKLRGPWELGKYASAVDAVVVCWLTGSALLALWLLKPAALLIAAGCLLAGAWCIERKQRSLRRKTPVKIVGSLRFGRRSMDECIRIERKFPQ
ncbi:amino acid permease [Paenibacillus sacheonensis]|uniref:Amino acid permease n=1 Tax=Paenibacillus sacheonensis TaxID=742054 RepID=A0A7X5BX86_9BACL|nr:amino acid permease [Paenibacillus sacheonensis]MBM7563327.1 amino acid transporter [Paenibacillus sacheonensis]NBC68116.1 amino acid permease [Paenibacillus sacheonensis]